MIESQLLYQVHLLFSMIFSVTTMSFSLMSNEKLFGELIMLSLWQM